MRHPARSRVEAGCDRRARAVPPRLADPGMRRQACRAEERHQHFVNCRQPRSDQAPAGCSLTACIRHGPAVASDERRSHLCDVGPSGCVSSTTRESRASLHARRRQRKPVAHARTSSGRPGCRARRQILGASRHRPDHGKVTLARRQRGAPGGRRRLAPGVRRFVPKDAQHGRDAKEPPMSCELERHIAERLPRPSPRRIRRREIEIPRVSRYAVIRCSFANPQLHRHVGLRG